VLLRLLIQFFIFIFYFISFDKPKISVIVIYCEFIMERLRKRARNRRERFSRFALKAGVATGGIFWLNRTIQHNLWDQVSIVGIGIAAGGYFSRKINNPPPQTLNWAQSPWVNIPIKSLLAVGAGLNAAKGGPEIMTLVLSGAAGGSLAEPITRGERVVYRRRRKTGSETPELLEEPREDPKEN
jgi:hypothetical protein